MKKFKKLSESKIEKIEEEVKSLLRHCRNFIKESKEYDHKKVKFLVNNGDYAEAFGVMRALRILGYGTLDCGLSNPKERSNLRWWLEQLCEEVLEEERKANLPECHGRLNVEYEKYNDAKLEDTEY